MCPIEPDSERLSFFQTRLLEWHAREHRQFPWRETQDPFRILLAEFLLQKTDAKKAVVSYEDLLRCYSSFNDMAQSTLDELRPFFKPIGLFYRAERLLTLARVVVEQYGGNLPLRVSDLKALPGVGDYIAGAVACFAGEEDIALIDTNSGRVITRVFSYEPIASRLRTDKELKQLAQRLVPTGKARDYNFALIDLAHLFCLPRKPNCTRCPLETVCDFSARH